jgi:5'-nucleotidase/UDP-sugar diphosphatase
METSKSTTSRKKVSRFLAFSVAIGILTWAGPGVPIVAAEELTILHTNDMHSHLLGYPEADYPPTGTGQGAVGGLARIATVVNQIREDRESLGIPVLLLDAGDFMMGTPFHLLQGEAEMGIMNALGYDAVVLGNHEYEWLPKGVAAIVSHAAGLPVVASNVLITDESNVDAQALKVLMESDAIFNPYYSSTPYLIRELSNGLKVGFLGLIGHGADDDVFRPDPEDYPYPLEFLSSAEDRITVATEAVSYLKGTAGVDIVICLSHSGVDKTDHTQGEDPDLARAVSGIDVIISGHTHTMTDPVTITNPTTGWNTIIAQAWEHTKWLGVLDLDYTPGTGVTLLTRPYYHEVIDENVDLDQDIQAMVEEYIEQVDDEIFNPLGYSFTDEIAETPFPLSSSYPSEHNLGNLITDSMRWAVNHYDPDPPGEVAVESNGVIDGIQVAQNGPGRLNTSDAFRAVPLGRDPVSPYSGGYPLISFCLYGSDLHMAAEANALAPLLQSSDYWLSWSGAGFQYAPYLVLNMWQCMNPAEQECTDQAPIPNNKSRLYRVAVNYYIASFIESIKDLSGGLIDIVPKDCETGQPLERLSEAIVYKDSEKTEPLSEWEGFLDYLASMPDTSGDGIPDIPARYSGPEDRMVKACFIATAAYGSPLEAKVEVLREFRNRILERSAPGQKFTDFYYAHSPGPAETIARSDWLKRLVRVFLLPVIGFAKIMLLIF